MTTLDVIWRPLLHIPINVIDECENCNKTWKGEKHRNKCQREKKNN